MTTTAAAACAPSHLQGTGNPIERVLDATIFAHRPCFTTLPLSTCVFSATASTPTRSALFRHTPAALNDATVFAHLPPDLGSARYLRLSSGMLAIRTTASTPPLLAVVRIATRSPFYLAILTHLALRQPFCSGMLAICTAASAPPCRLVLPWNTVGSALSDTVLARTRR